MRADRLISLLMLLQSRGRRTARQLAEQLGVSQRTIYRDLDALSISGIPLYADRGPGGGVELIESYRTSLTGLSAEETQALFMLSIPAALDQLGVGSSLKAALLKLSASLPPARRADEEMVRQRIYLDARSGQEREESLPWLGLIQQAVWQNRRLWLRYELEFWNESQQECEPYGLVARGNLWYLVGWMGGRMRVIRVSRVLEAALLEGGFQRLADFDLAAFWQTWISEVQRSQREYRVRVRVAARLQRLLIRHFGNTARAQIDTTPPGEDGWTELELPFEHFFAARERLLSYGSAIEVLEPLALRQSLIDLARQALSVYPRDEVNGLGPDPCA